jgi:hypothetical protein
MGGKMEKPGDMGTDHLLQIVDRLQQPFALLGRVFVRGSAGTTSDGQRATDKPERATDNAHRHYH